MSMRVPLGGGRVTSGELAQLPRQSYGAWVDHVRDGHNFTDIRRQQMVNAIYDGRKTMAEQALTKELQRTQLLPPKLRDKYTYKLNDASPYAQRMRRRAEEQAQHIINTDRKFREDWADRVRKPPRFNNRYQINNDLTNELDDRNKWKTPQIAETELQQAYSEAVADFYTETGIADPATDPYWYFAGPPAHDPKTCPICVQVLAGEPYTRAGLVAALDLAGAMAPDAFTAHPHERHWAEYRPPRGTVRRKENTNAAQAWAAQNGALQNVRGGPRKTISPPTAMPKRVRTRYPETAGPRLTGKVCGRRYRKWDAPSLAKWALQAGSSLASATTLCETLDEQLLGDVGENMVCELFGMTATAKGAPFDGLIGDEIGVEIKAKRASGKYQQLKMDARALERKNEYAAAHGLEPHTIAVRVDNEAQQLTVLHRKGFASFRLSTMTEVARVDMQTGVVEELVAALPWARKATP